ncbi:MAG: 2-dehydropantoate 2-reductase [Proteobacteria bacterium]|nr:2-dehydropantoate 2-reductase [Pseudomonadota bacterium]
MKQYNVLVYGTGAVGIFFGGKLFQAGFNVVLVDLPEKVKRLKESDLHIQSSIGKNYDFHPTIVEDLSELPPQDIILVCVKAFQTYDIALNLLPVVKPSTIALSLQNGLENEKILSDMLGINLVMGSVLYFNGQLEAESTVLQKAPANIIFGEMDHQPSEREEWLSGIFSHADIDHRISHNITREIWKKFIWNNAYNAISAITQTTLRQIYDSKEILPTIQTLMSEVQQVALAEGVEITDQNLEELMNIDLDHGDVKVSMLQDIESKRIPELEPLVGIVLQKAKKFGISTPVNQTIYNLIQLFAKQSGN